VSLFSHSPPTCLLGTEIFEDFSGHFQFFFPHFPPPFPKSPQLFASRKGFFVGVLLPVVYLVFIQVFD